MNHPDFLRLANPGIASLRPYEPGKPVEELERELGISGIVKLASNENPLGPSPKVAAALNGGVDIARYPDGSGFALKALLSKSLAVRPEQITLGNGSNDVLELLARVFLRPGTNAMCSAHAFAVYPLVTTAAGAQLRQVPALAADHEQAFGHDLDQFARHVDADTRLVFVANPNNPTGTWCQPQAIENLLATLPATTVVVLDEAYCEYQAPGQRPDSLALLARYPNLVLTRTFSKAYGLAALRIGFALSNPAIADLMNRIRQPFNANSAALLAAEVAWQDQAHVAASVQMNDEGKAFLHRAFAGLGLRCLPSQANFLCVDFGRDAMPIYQALLRQGVIARPLAGYQLPQHLRITIGTPAENRRCVEALQAVL